jgi:hypothetical protein
MSSFLTYLWIAVMVFVMFMLPLGAAVSIDLVLLIGGVAVLQAVN